MPTTISRRTVLQTAAMATTALATPFVRGAYAGGKLSCGFWDHWVPTANEPMSKICQEWADKNKVDLNIDFITSNGDKLLLTIAAEAQARSGHDILSIPTWYAAAQADNLVPMDDVMQKLIAANGKVSDAAEYLGKQNGHWVAVPGVWGNATFPCVGEGNDRGITRAAETESIAASKSLRSIARADAEASAASANVGVEPIRANRCSPPILKRLPATARVS